MLEEFQYSEKIVIRSDNGSQFIAKNVREYLKLIGVCQEFTHVATPEEKKLYQEHLDSNTYKELVIGKPGIQNIRNFMPKYFREGQPIVYMDDDLYHIWECVNNIKPFDKKNNKLIKMKNLDAFIKKAFMVSKKR